VKTKKIFNVYFREKPALMLVTLFNSSTDVYASNLAKHVDCTYSHVVKILQEMSKSGLISFQKQGRLKILKLTKKGEDVAKKINEIKALL
jgi:predicted transcriptional regulator